MKNLEIVLISILGILSLRTLWLLAKNSEKGKWRILLFLPLSASILAIVLSKNNTFIFVLSIFAFISTLSSEYVEYKERQELFPVLFFVGILLLGCGMLLSLIL